MSHHFLIVGLGNPGAQYAETRHSIGFKILNALADKKQAVFEDFKYGQLCQLKEKGKKMTLLKPSTFMNLSGKAVRYWLKELKIPSENLLVISDEIHLDFGTFRIKAKGSSGGHNGLKDIDEKLQGQPYARFRFGVGAGFSKGRQVDYVLGAWSVNEQKLLPELLEKANKAVTAFVLYGIAYTMNHFNGQFDANNG